MKKQILITSGDIDGVGLEVSVKALLAMPRTSGFEFVLFAHPKFLKKYEPALHNKFSSKTLTFIKSENSPVEWVIQAARHCQKNPQHAALVTGPLSKTGIWNAGYKEIGHTEVLKKITKSKALFQVYLGSKLNVILATDHVCLAQVPAALTNSRIKDCIRSAVQICDRIKINGDLVYLALDPHAGEDGLIGKRDGQIRQILTQFDLGRRKLIGPMPADSAFEEKKRKSIAMYIANYHDQGLIPFKTLHGFGEGVHLTAGLPFVRTSVDHGTAKDLFQKNRANSGSMKDAIKTAIKLLGK